MSDEYARHRYACAVCPRGNRPARARHRSPHRAGPRRRQAAARASAASSGTGMREFKDTVTRKVDEDDDDAAAGARAGRRASTAPPWTARSSASAAEAHPQRPLQRARQRTMASKLKPVGHDERLCLIEHLDELRTRLIICVAAFTVAFGVCLWQNDAVLDIINRPLEETAFSSCDTTKDPFEQANCWQQAMRRVNADLEALADEAVRQATTEPRLAILAERLEPVGRRRAGGDAARRRRKRPGDARRRRAVHRHRARRGVRGAAALAAAPALPALRVRAAGLLPARARGRAAADGDGAVPVHRGRRVRVLRWSCRAAVELPAELQRRQLRHPHPGARLLPVRDPCCWR